MSGWKIAMGVTAIDTLTGFVGVVTGRTEYLTGCRQYCICPPVGEGNVWQESKWFDEDRLLAYVRGASGRPTKAKIKSVVRAQIERFNKQDFDDDEDSEAKYAGIREQEEAEEAPKPVRKKQPKRHGPAICPAPAK
jgi:hypothetical protein